jgi:hypothetical protein
MFIEVVHGRAREVPQLLGTWTAALEALGKCGDRWLGATAGASDDRRFLAMLAFESEEGARNTIDRVSELAEWRDFRDSLEHPEFAECPNVRAFATRNLEEAESVDISRGKATEIPRLTASFTMMGRAAGRDPSVLGSLLCWNAEGLATVAVYRGSGPKEAVDEADAALERPTRIALGRPWSVLAIAAPQRTTTSKGGRNR